MPLKNKGEASFSASMGKQVVVRLVRIIHFNVIIFTTTSKGSGLQPFMVLAYLLSLLNLLVLAAPVLLPHNTTLRLEETRKFQHLFFKK